MDRVPADANLAGTAGFGPLAGEQCDDDVVPYWEQKGTQTKRCLHASTLRFGKPVLDIGRHASVALFEHRALPSAEAHVIATMSKYGAIVIDLEALQQLTVVES